MKKNYRHFLSILAVLAIIFGLVLPVTLAVFAQGTGCASSTPPSGTYTVTLCFSDPLDGSTLVDGSTVTVSVTETTSSPGVQRVIFYLDGEYLLTDFQSAYTFTLPTTKWVDGNHTLAVEALMRDAFVTQQAVVSVNFNNGITTPPVNTNQFQPTSGNPPGNGAPFIVAASGDGASGEINAGNVADLVTSLNPNLFLYLGDVYEKGSVAEFYNWYGTQTTNLGRLRSITDPTIGNHEYENGVAPGYFDYWDNVPDYYSFDANGWHFISLNSNSSLVPVDSQSAQYQWLQQDLAANPGACTIAYYHHPLFNIGAEPPKTSMSDIWALMAQYGVSIVLNGHDHDYQRWVPLDGNGQPSPTGITEFVAGGAGHGVQTFTTTDSRVAYSNDLNPAAFGVLLLQLNPDGVNFSYVNTASETLDSGVVPCVIAGPDSQAPSVPDGLSATASIATKVDLNWSASGDNTGVSGYTIYRDGMPIATAPGSSISYSDKTALPQTTYQYQVDAFDPAGNHSVATPPVSITTPPMSPTLTFNVEADTYVNASNPASKYGAATVLRADSSPDLHSYLRFTVEGLAGYPIGNVSLQVYASNGTSIGIDGRAVADNSWEELNTTYDNAPALGNVLASSGGYSTGDWVTLDVTSYVTGEGTYSFGLTTTGSTTLSFPSRESGANAAQLIVTFDDPSLDTEPPSIPTGLTATAVNASQVNLEWNASTDNVAVTGYTIYRNGAAYITVPGTSLSYSDTSASSNTTYQYSVDAFDATGNHSAASTPVSVTTPGTPSTLTFIPEADTYVNAGSTNSNYGTSTSLRADSTPDLHSYMRFNLVGSGGAPVTRARLFIYANSASSFDLIIQAVADNSWNEYAMTYNDAPPLGSTVAFVTPVTGGTWLEFDVTSYVTGDGMFSFGVSTSGGTSISLASRESGANAPQLIVDYQNDGGDTQAPEVPTGLAANATTATQVDLSWNASTDNVGVTGYTVYRDGAAIATLPGTSLSYSDTTVATATTYQYSVDAFDAAGNHSAASAPISVTTPDNQPPSVPTGFSANVISSTQVDMSWNASTDNFAVAGYTVYRDGVAIATLPDTSLAYSDTSALSGVTYSYAVDAFDLDGNHSALSNPVIVTTPDTEPPSAPTGVVANASIPTQVDLNWTASTDNVAVTGYTIYRDGVALDTVASTSLLYSDMTVSPASTYQYSVDAFDAIGNHSAPSAPVEVTTPNIPATLTFTPEADSYVNANNPTSNYGSQTSLRVDASPDLHSYVRFNIQGSGGASVTRARLLIYATSSSSNDVTILAVSDNSWDETTINYNNAPALGSVLTSVSPVSSSTWLEFDVTSYVSGEGLLSFGINTSGNRSIRFSSRESGANAPQLIVDFQNNGPDTQAPAIPAGLAANAISSTQVNLSWNASSDNVGVTGYTVYRDSVAMTTVSGSSLAYSDTTASPSTTYQYSVDAFDAAGNHSTASSPVSVTTPNNPPSVPTGLAANAVSSTQVDLSWNASTDDISVAGYTLYRDGVALANIAEPNLSFSDTSVLSGLTYSYTVDAVDGDGNHSAASNPVVVTTPDTEPPSVPGNLSANASNATQIDLSWNASTDNVAVTGYTIFRDGNVLTTIPGTSLSYSDTSVSPATSYEYSIDAFDAAGNHSSETNAILVSTPSVAPNLTFIAVADSYVSASKPTSNYGTLSSLRVDASPEINSYIRFDAQGLGGKTVVQAHLLIYVASRANQGIDIWSVTDNSWGETTVNYNNAPALGTRLGSSGLVSSAGWVDFDVTSFVTAEGSYSFGITDPSSTAVKIDARESGANAPQLILVLQ